MNHTNRLHKLLLLLLCSLASSFTLRAQPPEIDTIPHCITQFGISDLLAIQRMQTPVSRVPSARNTNQPATLHVMFHIACKGPDATTAVMSWADAINCLDSVNKFYSGSGLQFVACDAPQFMYNSPFYDFEPYLFPSVLSEDSLGLGNDGVDVIDIYVLHNIGNGYIGGYTWLPYNWSGRNHRVWLARDLAPAPMAAITSHLENGTVLAHELGHFFGLVHTNGDSTNQSTATSEFVDGSNGATAGDRIQDTPADPCNSNDASIKISGYTIYPYLNNQPPCVVRFCDPHGQEYQPLQNEMITFPSNYFNSFTPMQMSLMYANYLHYFFDTGTGNIDNITRFQGNSGHTGDLYIRDCTADVGHEPDTESINGWPQVWESPDIWNCRTSNTCPVGVMENPGYSDPTKHNYLQVQVNNSANNCYGLGSDQLCVYWTLGSTGEKWPNAWVGDTTFCGLPAGGALDSEVVDVPSGHSQIYSIPWQPVDPTIYNGCLNLETYDDTNGANPMICFLARLVAPAFDPMYNEQGTVTNPHGIGDNVYYNNNIATRNTSLINLPGFMRPAGGHDNTSSSLLIQNSEDNAATFDLHLAQQVATNKSPTFFSIGGNVTIHLDDAIWAAWVAGGQQGTNVTVSNSKMHKVLVTGNNAVLANVFMPADNTDQAIFTFNYVSQITDTAFNYNFAFYQTLTGVSTPTGSVCHFQVNNYMPDGGDEAARSLPASVSNITANNNFYLAPNPANNTTSLHFNLAAKTNVSIFITDMVGKTVARVFNDKPFNAGTHYESIPLNGLSSGVYFVHLKSNMFSQTAKLVVTKQ